MPVSEAARARVRLSLGLLLKQHGDERSVTAVGGLDHSPHIITKRRTAVRRSSGTN